MSPIDRRKPLVWSLVIWNSSWLAKLLRWQIHAFVELLLSRGVTKWSRGGCGGYRGPCKAALSTGEGRHPGSWLETTDNKLYFPSWIISIFHVATLFGAFITRFSSDISSHGMLFLFKMEAALNSPRREYTQNTGGEKVRGHGVLVRVGVGSQEALEGLQEEGERREGDCRGSQGGWARSYWVFFAPAHFPSLASLKAFSWAPLSCSCKTWWPLEGSTVQAKSLISQWGE